MNNQIKPMKNGKKLEKKDIAIIALVVVAIILVIVLAIIRFNSKGNNKETSEGKKAPEAVTAEGIVKSESYGGLDFSNVILMGKDENNNYVMTMDVTNNSDKEVNLEKVGITLKDKDGNKIITLLGYIGDPMKPKETRQITAYTQLDLSKSYTKEIGEYKE